MTARLFAFALSGIALFAQEFRSTVAGRVLDAQEAAVAGVKITATQTETGAKSETISGTDGLYTIPFLAPGTYKIEAESAGFKRYVRNGIQVSTNTRVALDIALEVGQVTESVTVAADVPMLQTATASVGQVITSRQIENLPMSGRTPLTLAQLAFGVIPTAAPTFTRPFDNQGPSDFAMGGSPNRSNELLLDGAPNTTGNNRVAFNPPVDAVAEVKVESFQADAAYGHAGGGTVNVVMKSGTNAFHGSAYEFNQVSRFAATPFFTNRAGLRKTVTRYNQWGLTAGGPVYLPKIVDGRNRLFFFFAYEGIKDSVPLPTTATVPTEAQRGGDLSGLLRLGANYQIYDPATGAAEGARVRRQPFQGNVVPASRISPIAANYLKLLPLPNQPGRADGGDNFLSNTDGEKNDFSSYLGRMDVNLSTNHKLFVSARFNDRVALRGNRLGYPHEHFTSVNGTGRTNWGATVDDVLTLSPTMVWNTRANWTRFEEPRPNMSRGFDVTSLGLPSYLGTNSTNPVLPRFVLDRFTSPGDTGGVELPFDQYQLFSTVTKIVSKHTVKAGFDGRWLRESGIDYGNSAGVFNFSTNWTRGPLDNAAASPIGQDLAALLLGLPTGGSYDVNGARTNQASYFAVFAQDDWRVRPDLTINLGLRYERDLPTVERFNRSVNGFDFASANPLDAAASAAYNRNPIAEIPAGQFRVRGGLLFANPNDRNVYETRANNFSPRFGFAYTPRALGGRTVFRGGFGLFIYPFGTLGVNQIGFNQTTALTPTLNGFLTPAATLANPFPNGIERPTGSSLGLATFLGRSVQYFNDAPLNPYSIRWNFDIQHEIARDTVIQAGYVYNHSVHLGVDRPFNGVPAQYLSSSPTRDQPVIDRMTALVPNPFAGLVPGTPLNGANIARNQLLRAFPQFTAVTGQQLSDGRSYFHMLQARIERRFSSGLSLLANGLWSKLIERRSYLNDAVPTLEKRIAGEDRPWRVVLSGSYELPFGKGRAFAANANPWVNAVVGGWIVNAIYTAQPGGPLTWGNVIYLGGDLAPDARDIDRAFDTTRFNRVATQQLEFNLRTLPSRFSNLRADMVNNLDASVMKNFSIKEVFTAQFRFEAFNTLNRAQFGGPNVNPTASPFGTIASQANQPRRIQMALRLVW